jgi:shikimate dehydrogenase
MDVVSIRPERAHSVDFVDGCTRLYGILGHPIEQVRSPQTVTFELRRRGVNAILVPLHILPEDFDEVFPRLLRLANLDGLVVTVPHKSAVCRLLDKVGPLASFSGGVSVIARSSDDQWIGEMFDGSGCVRALSKRGVRLQGRHVLILGAGGAGSAIAAAIARQGPARITLQEPDRDRRQALMHKIAGNFPDISLSDETPPLEQVDVLVNASPVGMLDETRMPIDADRIPQHVVVMDAIMDPDRTRLLGVAEESKCVTVYGREMLDAQIAGVCDFLLGAREERADRIGFDH